MPTSTDAWTLPARGGRSLLLLVAAGAAVALTALVGALAATAQDEGFYEQLDKPGWSPPSGVFSPVWTALYVLMAVAAWLVAREGLGQRRVQVALGLFACQLVLNAAWTPLFFAAERIVLAAVEIVVLLALVLATTVAFWRVRPLAGGLLVPYAAWVAFATALNVAIAVRA